jgi:membrane protein YqaA with SNARE-associated domain
MGIIASVGSILGGVAGWMIGYFAFATIARPVLEFYGKLDEFEA